MHVCKLKKKHSNTTDFCCRPPAYIIIYGTKHIYTQTVKLVCLRT